MIAYPQQPYGQPLGQPLNTASPARRPLTAQDYASALRGWGNGYMPDDEDAQNGRPGGLLFNGNVRKNAAMRDVNANLQNAGLDPVGFRPLAENGGQWLKEQGRNLFAELLGKGR